MKAFARVVTVILALALFAAGFAGATAALDVFQPANAKVTTMVKFEVKPYPQDTTNTVAQRLQDEGLIRNALVFRLWARYKHLDRGVQAGVYLLSPSMTMNQIVNTLQSATPDEIAVTIPDGMRATQYPDYIQGLSQFDPKAFLTTAKTGVEPDGTKLWQKYWFIPQPGPNVAYALEGYLYPAGYDFFPNATTTTVVEKMLDQFGIELCPGPSSKPAQYIYDAKLCHQNAATINGTNIFDLMHAAYPDAKSDTDAIHDMLIISSLATKEVRHRKDAVGVAAMYHNRYLHDLDANRYPADVGQAFGSDPSVEYARDTDKPPTNDKWWKGLVGVSGNDVSPNNPYNTYTHGGMPPGPIASPYWDAMEAGIAPANSPYWYIYSDNCGAIYYAKDFAGFQQIQAQAANAKC
ncbi:MAG TPA: endolytic transglycosylase MltG [Ktedonobacterales bacterium]